MGLLGFISKREPSPIQAQGLARLPSGSFTLDPAGRVVASTLPRSFPEAMIHQIGRLMLQLFESARKVELPLSEVVAEYAALRLTARELRGGAIIFLAPRSIGQK